jgi:hypothetical protein
LPGPGLAQVAWVCTFPVPARRSDALFGVLTRDSRREGTSYPSRMDRSADADDTTPAPLPELTDELIDAAL